MWWAGCVRGGCCVRGRSSFVGDRCHGWASSLSVGGASSACVEGCARGGARRPSWFARDRLSAVVGVRVGGGSSLPEGACRSWVRGWGIIVVGRVSPSIGGSLSVVESLSVCACGRCWWWRSSPVVAVEQWWVVAAVRGGGRRQPVMVVVERWPSSLGDGGGDCR